MQVPSSNAYPAPDHPTTSPNNVEVQDTKTSDEARAAAGEVMAHWAEHESQTFEEKKRHGKEKGAHHKNDTAGPKKENGYPKTVEISDEKIDVSSAAEEKEAQQIITTIKLQYGVDVSSQAGMEAIKAEYKKVPKQVTDKLKTKQWKMKELRAVKLALDHFAPILGKNRKDSSRKDEAQEVTSVSKLEQSIDVDSKRGRLDGSDKDATLGEYFKGAKNFSMFSAGTNTALNFKTSERQLEGTATHELAHGLLRYELGGFIQATGYWLDAKTKSGAPDAEVPPTSYGKTNASEDLSESAMFFFMAPQPLQEKCPKRHKFLKGVVESWHSQKPGGAATK